jgi:hypothetical protein
MKRQKLITYLLVLLLLFTFPFCTLERDNPLDPESPYNPPSIVSIIPSDLSKDIAVTSNVLITFSKPMDRASAEGAFSLSDNLGKVNGNFSWVGETMTFNPSSNLAYSTTYHVKVTKSAMDTYGIQMKNDFNSSFITASFQVQAAKWGTAIWGQSKWNP